ncbi:putative ethanolamine kinase [Ceratocystis lukuohia]|uniref:ethanolamine kinase n=1 Tax=Ceratocystis lukuohia TaxID=2019550 RepID=A0ABR4MKE1_9PEZI
MTAHADLRHSEPVATAINGQHKSIPFLPLSYDSHNSEASSIELIKAIEPDWVSADGNKLNDGVKIVRCTDGITNTLLKIINTANGTRSADEADKHAFLLRAYGNGTDVIIDREREAENHELLMRHGLAPELLARFQNGMLYRYIRGTVTHPEDLRRPEIFTAVARRLAEWHATVPCIAAKDSGKTATNTTIPTQGRARSATSGKPVPNMWTVLQKWILALPTQTDSQKKNQSTLQAEFEWLRELLGGRPTLGENGLVFAHCDLLHGNIIVEPKDVTAASGSDQDLTVCFIDYEYATPSPAAFDICNHFAEWGGFECDYNVMPSKAQRLSFIRNYIATYFAKKDGNGANSTTNLSNGTAATPLSMEELENESQKLFIEVDLFRGIPGFYWGIWSQIQAVISEIDFDYASYANVRLGEYWAWKAEFQGTRKPDTELCLREKRWAAEE